MVTMYISEKGCRMKILKLTIIFLLITGISLLAYAEKTTRTAKILEVRGKVDLISPEGKMVPVSPGVNFTVGDTLKTQTKSHAVLQFDGSETVTIDMYEGSELLFSEFTKNKKDDTQLTFPPKPVPLVIRVRTC